MSISRAGSREDCFRENGQHTYGATVEDYEHAHPPTCWYALYTKHQHEKTVAHNLLCKGFETFLPLYASARNWKDRAKLLHLPLFPCYVFLKTNLERRLDIITAPGVYGLVSSGGQPATIPAAQIESIRQVVGSSAHVEPYPFLKCGDWVRVRSGPLTGVQGILVRIKTIYRLVVSVEMLGRAAAVEIDALSVERLDEKPCGVYSSEMEFSEIARP